MWIYLKVPFAEKDDAKALGARFDPERKLWYATDKVNFRHFKKWMNPGSQIVRWRRLRAGPWTQSRATPNPV